MNLFKRNKTPTATGIHTASRESFRLAPAANAFETEFYDTLRAQVPIIDACIGKIIRLTNDFRLECDNKKAQRLLDSFSHTVPIGVSGSSITTFADLYLDTLLTYGRCIGELSVDAKRGKIRGLYISDPTHFRVEHGTPTLALRFFESYTGDEIPITHPERILYTTLNPSIKHPEGVSILRGIPALSQVLMRIYECIGQNFDRVGNVRYAVTYKPSADPSDKAYAKDRAMEIAREWSNGMSSARNGVVKDFVAVGDVEIKVIGADNQIIDTQIPVRQLLEQIVAKLGIPPFLLGLSWSSTERMSAQQCDILTSELEYYRRLLTPVLLKIGNAFLQINGFDCDCEINWANINLQDEEELARARLYNAQAAQLEIQNREDENIKL